KVLKCLEDIRQNFFIGVDVKEKKISWDGVEMEQFRALSIVIEGVLLHDMVDRWKRALKGSGEFSVASARKFIDNSRLIGSPKKTRWIKMVPIKVNILAWKVQFDLLPTRLNLSRRDIEIQNICCPVCIKQVESMNHLFFACSLARDIYRKIALWISSKHKELLEGIYYAMWWQKRYSFSRFQVAFSPTIWAGGGGAKEENATHGVVLVPWGSVFVYGLSHG
nr:RNA-directed DNA polymerase, eukaryota [Tanacetum cinerariifolium]